MKKIYYFATTRTIVLIDIIASVLNIQPQGLPRSLTPSIPRPLLKRCPSNSSGMAIPSRRDRPTISPILPHLRKAVCRTSAQPVHDSTGAPHCKPAHYPLLSASDVCPSCMYKEQRQHLRQSLYGKLTGMDGSGTDLDQYIMGPSLTPFGHYFHAIKG